ncbi:RHS repeat-associated core domain-containing protein [Streptomyces sp. NPDC048564]|uniref:RHS repeat-associated core domain-containing protein n=1 Tax=Streptomyces sp. NPDC048564 TaxID=3155760 RepID=UPI0034340B1C
MGGTTVASTTYGYDLDDNSTSKKTTGTAGAGDNTYGYDYAGRLTSWTKGGATTAYEWDAAGNRTKTGTTATTFDARNRQLTDGTKQLTYTARGTLASVAGDGETSRALTFDAFERKISDGSATYTYDSLDRVQTRGATTFTYDGGSNRLANDGSTNYNRTSDGTLLSLATGSTKQWAVTDKHTDLVAGLNPDAAQVTGSTAYDPFGTETATTGTTPAVGYQSGWTDPTTGDANMAARWYQPGTGSFTSRDTWLLDPVPSSEANRYTYVGGDPLDATDPTGHSRHHEMGSGWGSVGTLGRGGTRSSFSGRVTRPNTRATTRSTGRRQSRAQSRSQSNRFQRQYGSASRPYGVRSSARPGTTRGTGRPATFRSSGRPNYGTVSRGNTPYRPSGAPRSSTNTRPPKPPTPQNPNRGPNPRPAPARPAPKPRVDVVRIQQGAMAKAVVVDREVMLDLAGSTEYSPEDSTSLGALQDLFPGQDIDPDLGYGKSGADPNAGRTRNACSRDFPSTDPAFYYAPMTRFGSGPDDCRATGAVAFIDAYDLRPWRLDPKWKPAGFGQLSVGNRAALHLIGNQMGGANDTLRNFVAGYQTPANSPHMRSLEDDITRAVKAGERVALGVLPVYNGTSKAIPTEIEMHAVGDDGYRLNCTVYNRPTGGYSCSERSSGGNLSIP